MLNSIKSFCVLLVCLFALNCYSCQAPRKRTFDEVCQSLQEEVMQEIDELAITSKRPCRITRAESEKCKQIIEKDINYLLEVLEAQQRENREPIEEYNKLQAIFWKPHNLPLLKYALDKKIIRRDAKFLHSRNFFQIPYEGGFKLLREAEPDNYFGNMHELSLAVLSDLALLINRYMKENPPKKAIDNAMIRAINGDKFPILNVLLYHGANPFVKDGEGDYVVDFMMNEFLESNDEKAGHCADILQHAHWRRTKRLADLLFQCPGFRKISTCFSICIRIAEFRYGYSLTNDEEQNLIDAVKAE